MIDSGYLTSLKTTMLFIKVVIMLYRVYAIEKLDKIDQNQKFKDKKVKD